MYTVRQLLKNKGQEVWSTTPDTPVLEALQLMAEKDVGALLVMDGNRLAGIFSERDYARKIVLEGKTSRETLVREIMTSRVNFVTPRETLGQCMALMTEKYIRHLPVLDEGNQVVGVISIGDVVKATIDNQEFVIEQLESYITGDTAERPVAPR